MKFPTYPSFYQSFSVFLFVAIPVRVKWSHVVWIGISLSTSGGLFLKKCLFRFSVHFEMNYYCFSYWIVKDFIYSEYNSISSYRIRKSSHTLSRFFYLFFEVQSFSFSCPLCFGLSFVPCVYSFIVKKLRLTPVFSWNTYVLF